MADLRIYCTLCIEQMASELQSFYFSNFRRHTCPEVKRPGGGADHLPPSSAEVEERVELYPY